jgi:glutathione synthase/RimK-type ligase-like ATP-grasp enzyme
MRFLGITRKSEFSPNHVVSDFLIFQKTAQALEARGVEVTRVDESEVATLQKVDHDLVFSMVQGPTGTQALLRVEERTSAPVVNSPRAVMNCYRTNMVRLMPAADVPFPKSRIVDTCLRDAPDFGGAAALWVKRGDVHAVHKEDVALAHAPEEAMELLQEFRGRGIKEAILQEHVPGATVKFYGVRGTDFFHHFATDGTPVPFDAEYLRGLAGRSAEAMGLYVYGGDVIVREDGTMVVIDVNDWPSFGPVRDVASEKIASVLYEKGREHGRR